MIETHSIFNVYIFNLNIILILQNNDAKYKVHLNVTTVAQIRIDKNTTQSRLHNEIYRPRE